MIYNKRDNAERVTFNYINTQNFDVNKVRTNLTLLLSIKQAAHQGSDLHKQQTG